MTWNAPQSEHARRTCGMGSGEERSTVGMDGADGATWEEGWGRREEGWM